MQVTHDITDICSAEFLSEIGRRTPLHTRFSTVVHESGSPESLRDTRGFSIKFYTNEGNWDFVGNNMPVSQPTSHMFTSLEWFHFAVTVLLVLTVLQGVC